MADRDSHNVLHNISSHGPEQNPNINAGRMEDAYPKFIAVLLPYLSAAFAQNGAATASIIIIVPSARPEYNPIRFCGTLKDVTKAVTKGKMTQYAEASAIR